MCLPLRSVRWNDCAIHRTSEPKGGVEPPTSSLPRMRSNHLSYLGARLRDLSSSLERETGLEPATPSLEGLCSSQLSYSRPKLYCVCLPPRGWRGEDSNLRRRKPTGLQPVPVDRFGTSPKNPVSAPTRILYFFAREQNDPAPPSTPDSPRRRNEPLSLFCVARALDRRTTRSRGSKPAPAHGAELARGLEPPTC